MKNSPAIRPVPVTMTRLSDAPRFRVPAHNAGAADGINEWLDGTDELSVLAAHDSANEYEREYRASMGRDLYFDFGYYKFLSREAEAAEAAGNWIDADLAYQSIDLLSDEADARYDAYHVAEDYDLTGNRFPL